jgi:hypothetical protein
VAKKYAANPRTAHTGRTRIKRFKRSFREIWVKRIIRMTRVTRREIRNLFNDKPLFLIDDHSKT